MAARMVLIVSALAVFAGLAGCTAPDADPYGTATEENPDLDREDTDTTGTTARGNETPQSPTASPGTS